VYQTHRVDVHTHIRGDADMSLARPRWKQATATKLRFYSTYSPRSSIPFLASCSNFCKLLFSVQPGLRCSNGLCVGRKMANFQFYFQSREQVVVRRVQIRRLGWVIKYTGSPGRPVSSGLQVPGKPGHCRARTRHPS
jgi:hypothetical protein